MVDNDGMWYDNRGTDADELEWMGTEDCVVDEFEFEFELEVIVDGADECKLDLVDCDLLKAERTVAFACDIWSYKLK